MKDYALLFVGGGLAVAYTLAIIFPSVHTSALLFVYYFMLGGIVSMGLGKLAN
jgi:hypothetical protein